MVIVTNKPGGGIIVGASTRPSGIIISAKGRDGTSIEIRGSVPTYADLPTTDLVRGELWIVETDGLGYFWNGQEWPAEGKGVKIQGPKGDTGVGITSIVVQGNSLKFTYTDGTSALVEIPAIQDALDAAQEAATSAAAAGDSEAAAHSSELSAAGSAGAAEQSKIGAGEFAQASGESALQAKASETAAAGSASASHDSAEASQLSATESGTEAGKAKTERLAAEGAATQAASSAQGAAGSESRTSQMADAAALSATGASDSALAASTSEGKAKASELEAKRWAEEAAGAVAGVATIEGLSGAVTLAQLNLDKVDNTRDMDKPLSTPQGEALISVEQSGQIYTDAQIGPLRTELTNTTATATQTAANLTHLIDGVNSPEGLLQLGEDGKIMSPQLPSYVDDVLEYPSLATFPNPGEKGKIYTAEDTNQVYRWGGTSYIEVSPSPGSTDAVPEGQTNLYFSAARAVAAAKAGILVPYPVALVAALGTRKVGMTELVGGTGPLPDAVTFSKMVLTFDTADASGSTTVQILKNGAAVSGMTLACSSAAQSGPIAGRTATGTWAFAMNDVLTVQITGVGNTPGKGLTVSLTGKAGIPA